METGLPHLVRLIYPLLDLTLENLHVLAFKGVSRGLLHKPLTPLNMLNITANVIWS